MEQEKKSKLKISKKIMIVGIVMLVIGIICLIASISSFVSAKRAYDVAYDQWHDDWWYAHTADLNDMPDRNYIGKIFLIFLSVALIIVSIFVITVGARPYMSKFAEKYNNEINSYATEELGKLQKTAEEKPSVNHKKVCGYCGAKLDKTSSTCNYCGKDN